MGVANDVLIGSKAVRDIHGWRQVDRIVVVDGVAGNTWLEKVNAARTTAGLVTGGEHPELQNLFLKELRAECKATDIVKFVALYDRLVYNEEVMKIDASVYEKEIYRDAAGDLMTLKDAAGANEYTTFVKKFVPQTAFVSTKSGRIKSASSLRSEAQDYVGYVNSSSWNGGDARTWLMTSIKSISVDSGARWTTTFTAAYNPDTWDADAIYFDSTTGKAIYNPDDDVDAEKTFVIYGTANFGSLSIT